MPQPLPRCDYPTAGDVERHGLQALPDRLPRVDLAMAAPYRSDRHRVLPLDALAPAQILDTARLVAESFVRREPMTRHIRPARQPPDGLMAALHVDPFGAASFGPWSAENLLYWFIRLFILTDPASPPAGVRVREDVLRHSFAAVAASGAVIGGAFGETMPPIEAAPGMRTDDRFLAAVDSFLAPIMALLHAQETAALPALSRSVAGFGEAYAAGRVGHPFMAARSDALAKEDAFELLAVTVERFRESGHRFLCLEATNQWSGAACEVMGGVRVHFAPYQARPAVRLSAEPLPAIVTSSNGYLSDKDSGSMLYAIAL
jgi:hypothetical protein